RRSRRHESRRIDASTGRRGTRADVCAGARRGATWQASAEADAVEAALARASLPNRNSRLDAESFFLCVGGVVVRAALKSHRHRVEKVPIRGAAESERDPTVRFGRPNATKVADGVNAYGMQPSSAHRADVAKRCELFARGTASRGGHLALKQFADAPRGQ